MINKFIVLKLNIYVKMIGILDNIYLNFMILIRKVI
jgi:hypothetical protein